MGLKQKIALKRLQKTEGAIKRTPEIPDLNSVKKVGVIWQPEQKEAFLFLQDYFSKKQVVFRNLCVYTENVELAAESNSVVPKDLDWLGFPKPCKIDGFTEIQFDILLNIVPTQNITLDYISLVTPARFKIGGTMSEKNYFDLNINIGQNQDALYLAEQQIFYLGQLNKKSNK